MVDVEREVQAQHGSGVEAQMRQFDALFTWRSNALKRRPTSRRDLFPAISTNFLRPVNLPS